VAKESGTQFGPVAAEAFLRVPEKIFENLQAQRPEAARDLPERVQTLRSIDPSFFGAQPAGAR
jgi:hypothetical protein